MILSAIVAIADNFAIGKGNDLPWHLPEDLKFFKRTTLGKPVLMGRKTYESLGRPLKGRLNIVLSSQESLELPEGVLLSHNLEDALQQLKAEATEEAFVIGGGNVYKQSMEVLDRLYVTRVHTTVDDAEAFFPKFDEENWELVWEEAHKADEKHKYDYTFQQWNKIKNAE